MRCYYLKGVIRLKKIICVKTVFILLIISLTFSCKRNGKINENNSIKPISNSSVFSLNIKLFRREKSKDSHGSEYTINIHDRKVEFNSINFGFRAKPGQTKTFTLKPEVFGKLVDYIKKKSLNRNVKEIKETGNLGLTVKLNVKLTLEGKTTDIVIHGMYNDWSRRGQKKRTNLENIRVYEQFENIVNALKNNRGYF